MAPPLPDHDVVGAESCGELGRVRPLAQAGSGTRTPSYMCPLEGHPILATSLTTGPSLRIGKNAIEGDAPVRAVLLGPWAQRLLGRGVSHGLKLHPAHDRLNVPATQRGGLIDSPPHHWILPGSLPLSQRHHAENRLGEDQQPCVPAGEDTTQPTPHPFGRGRSPCATHRESTAAKAEKIPKATARRASSSTRSCTRLLSGSCAASRTPIW